jgi:hypothetical protein
MKIVILFVTMLFFSSQTAKNEKIEVGAMKSVDLNYPEFADFDISLSNSSGIPIDVSVINPTTNKQVKGFGLGSYGNVTLSVEKGHILKLKNNSVKSMKVTLDFLEKRPDNYNPEGAPVVNFTLHNSSLKSIPLIIPNVMNPNLYPMSNSGVSLKIGQEIFYKKGNETVMILKVDESIRQGDKIDVAKLIKDLKKD